MKKSKNLYLAMLGICFAGVLVLSVVTTGSTMAMYSPSGVQVAEDDLQAQHDAAIALRRQAENGDVPLAMTEGETYRVADNGWDWEIGEEEDSEAGRYLD